MIYTLTCNPSLDYIMRIKDLHLQETNRCYEESIYAGGKGINVSTVLHTLGYPSVAYGFIAGFVGEEIIREVQTLGFQSSFIHLKEGNSRINVKLKHGVETEINGIGPIVDETAIEALFDALDTLQSEDWLILSGSIPPSLPSDFYERILHNMQKKQVHVIVDASGDLLQHTLSYRPFLIKPNHAEVEEVFHVKIHNTDELVHYGKKLQAMGARNVLISRGNKGAFLISENGVFQCEAIQGTLINSVGAGDAMVAGFLAGYLKTKSYEDALCLGTATGCATAFEERFASEEKIMKLYKQLQVQLSK